MPRLSHIDFVWSDGGRAEAGYKGYTGDCVVRAITIALDLHYEAVYQQLKARMIDWDDKRVAAGKKRGHRSPRDGVPMEVVHPYLKERGWVWVPTMGIGTGCTMHLRRGELPPGPIIVRLSRHVAAVIDGVLWDLSDCSRDGTRCVYGIWKPAISPHT